MNPSTKYYNFLLWPLTLLYRLVVGIRNFLFDYNILKSKEFNLPIISVGNLTAGGTGKTPFTEYLASILHEQFRVATLSRGYKRKSKGFRYVEVHSTIDETGDEPLQIKRKYPHIRVAVDRDRVNGINQILNGDKDLNVILLDDAFQHRYVKPGLSILLVDFNKPLSSERFLPLGRLREPIVEKKRAHIVIVTKCPEKIKPIDQRIIQKDLRLLAYQNLYFTSIKYQGLIPVFKHDHKLIVEDDFRNSSFRILLVSGIASPRPFKKYLRRFSPKITELTYPDHHQFRLKDIYHIQETFQDMEGPDKIIITTEKDAVRLQKFHNIVHPTEGAWYYVPIVISFIGDDEQAFNKQIVDYVTKNKRHSILSSE